MSIATSPGQIKGLALIEAVKGLRSQKERVREALPAEAQDYLDEKIFASMWYPENDLLVLLRTLQSLMPPRPDFWEWIGRVGAEKDFREIYSVFIQRRRPRVTIERYPRIWRLYHDHGKVSVRAEGDGMAEIDIVANLVEDEHFCRLQSGHFQALLELAGGSEVRVDTVAVGRGREPARWRATWT